MNSLKGLVQRCKGSFLKRWWTSAIANAAIQGSAAVRIGWFQKYSGRACHQQQSVQETPRPWDEDQVGEGIVPPHQPM